MIGGAAMKANDKSQEKPASIGQLPQLRRQLHRPVSAAPNAVTPAVAPMASEPESHQSNQLSSCSPTSSCGDTEGHVCQRACPSTFSCAGCEDVLHELANVMTAVLTNTQVLSWKLPPYSHLKRSVREMERNAQRCGELLKRLVSRCAEKGSVRRVQP